MWSKGTERPATRSLLVLGALLIAGPLTASLSFAQTKIAAIGASTTMGSGAPSGQSYPDQLQRLLGAGYQVRNFGKSGAGALRQGNPTYWNSTEQRAAAAFAPDIVINWLGGADSKAASWDAHKAEFLGDYKAMIKYFQDLPSRPKIISMMSVARYNDAGVRKDVLEREVNPLQRQGAMEMGSRFIDTKSLLNDRAEYFTDGVHLTQAGYAVVAKAAEAEVRALAVGPDAGADAAAADSGVLADATGQVEPSPDAATGAPDAAVPSAPDATAIDASRPQPGSSPDAQTRDMTGSTSPPARGPKDGDHVTGCTCKVGVSAETREGGWALIILIGAAVLAGRRFRTFV
jgi:acyl-CoA thioesterase-1